jgi:hypothetical protein
VADLTDIKPCPACGKKAELRAGWAFWIECECGESSDGWTSIEDAINDWNAGDDDAPDGVDACDGAKR